MAKTAPGNRKKTRTVAYDIAKQLRTPEEMAAYLDAWLSEAPDDVSGIARALGDIARAKGMTEVARETGLSRESLYKALSDEERLRVWIYIHRQRKEWDAKEKEMVAYRLVDLVGLDTRLSILEYLHRSLGEKYRPCPLLAQYVKAGRLGRKAGRGVYDY